MKLFARRSFRFQMTALAVLFFSAMLAVVLFVFGNSVHIITQNRMNDISLMIDKYADSLTLTSERYHVLLNNLRYSSSVQKAMTTQDPKERANVTMPLMNDLYFYKTTCPGVLDILLCGRENSIYIHAHTQDDVPSDLLTQTSSRAFYSKAYLDWNIYSEGNPVFFLGGTVPGGTVPGRAGIALLAIDSSTLVTEFAGGHGGDSDLYYYFLDREGSVFASNVSDAKISEQIFSRLGAPKEHVEMRNQRFGAYSVSLRHMEAFGISLVVALPQSSIDQMTFLTFSWSFLIVVALYGVISLAISRTLRNVLHPMESMIQVMDEVNLRDISSLSVRAQVKGFKEIDIMVSHFNSMLDTIQRLNSELVDSLETLYYQEILKRETELNYMRSQINPHFLYNTLETIRGMAVIEDAPLVQKMVGALVRIFRYNVKEKENVLLSEEMDMIQSYLLIQTLRFGDRLSVEYDVEEEAKQCIIPKMLLQPLVENLVQHGIEGSETGAGRIRIAAAVEDKTLVLDCSDNGRGMSPEELAHVYENIYATETAGGTGIGFRNVYGRLKLLYSDHFQFTITSQKHVGTHIHIEIPVGGASNGTHSNPDC